MKKIIPFSLSKLRYTLFFSLLLYVGCIHAQGYYFYVQFTDKADSPYSIDNPTEFLSQRAIERRAYFNIDIDENDLPVNPSYLESLKEVEGLKIHSISKWMNSATIMLADSNIMLEVRSLPFVEKTEYTGKYDTDTRSGISKFKTISADENYGSATAQIEQVKGNYLHSSGYRGENIYIAVLDAGFKNVDINPAFDSLRNENRLLFTKDVIDLSSNIYQEHLHGANVLSIMGGNIEDSYLGTAPKASYILVRTEYDPTEYLAETDFWISGIEFADSLGADVVNSSLGYTEFDDAAMNFTYADMDGETTRITRAAQMAAQKGIIVCNSAGNDGNSTWRYVGAPADAKEILTIGAVNSLGVASATSSYGPTSDNRIKPELCATGAGTALVNTSGTPTTGSGTSYSSPLLAGLMACYLQFIKENNHSNSVSEILNSVIATGGLYSQPDAQLGYGLPDFEKAINNWEADGLSDTETEKYPLVIQRGNEITIRFENNLSANTAALYDITGKLIYTKTAQCAEITVPTSNYPSGIYLLSIYGGKTGRHTQKVIL